MLPCMFEYLEGSVNLEENRMTNRATEQLRNRSGKLRAENNRRRTEIDLRQEDRTLKRLLAPRGSRRNRALSAGPSPPKTVQTAEGG
jgi:hypothetical protein